MFNLYGLHKITRGIRDHENQKTIFNLDWLYRITRRIWAHNDVKNVQASPCIVCAVEKRGRPKNPDLLGLEMGTESSSSTSMTSAAGKGL